jgi:hypothetical protein
MRPSAGGAAAGSPASASWSQPPAGPGPVAAAGPSAGPSVQGYAAPQQLPWERTIAEAQQRARQVGCIPLSRTALPVLLAGAIHTRTCSVCPLMKALCGAAGGAGRAAAGQHGAHERRGQHRCGARAAGGAAARQRGRERSAGAAVGCGPRPAWQRMECMMGCTSVLLKRARLCESTALGERAARGSHVWSGGRRACVPKP